MFEQTPEILELEQLLKKGMKGLNLLNGLGLLCGLVMGPAAAFFLSNPVWVANSPIPLSANDLRGCTIFSYVVTLIAIAGFIEQGYKLYRDRRLFNALFYGQKEVVWVYKEISTAKVRHAGSASQVGQFTHVCFNFTNHSSALIWLSGPEVDRVLQLVHHIWPDVTVGYTAEIEQTYRQDPESLWANPKFSPEPRRTSGSTTIH